MKLKYILFLLMSLFLIFNSYAINNNSDLVAHWKLEDLTDSSGNGYTLTNNGATTSSSCHEGNCYYFGGSSDSLSLSTITISGEFTASIWLNIDSLNKVHTLFDMSGENSNKYQLRPDLSPDKFQFFMNGNNLGVGFSGNVLSTSTWYHLVLTRDSSNVIRLYLDNTLIGSTTNSNDFKFNLIGDDSAYNNDLQGYIDEISIWSISFNSNNVTDIYNNGIEYTNIGLLSTNIQEYYNSTNVSIDVNYTSSVEINYSVNGAANISLGSTNETSFNIIGVEGNNNIIFYFEDQQESYNFTIDTIKPTINLINSDEINNYNIDWTTRFNYSDENINTCEVLINGGDNTSNCDTNFTFYYNGNNTILINVTDLAGNYNTVNYTQFVNPTFYIYFNDNTENLQNFSVNGVEYEEYFTGQIYDYGLINNSFLFQKGGYDEFIFYLNFTNTFDDLNQTIFTFPVFFTIQLIDISNGNNAPNNNYTLFVRDTETDDVEVYNINNSNNIVFQNNYESNKEIEIRVILNTTLSNTNELITARKNVTIPIYLNFETTSPRIIEVLKPTLIVIPDSQVYLYKYIPGDGFVLETIKTTNVLGQVYFNIVENTAIYNICNTYEGATKCLSQVSFENVETDPYQIVHDSQSVSVQEVESMYINWSYLEEKNTTQNISKITFNLVDSQLLVESFCVNVTRYNGSLNNLGEYCKTGSSGQVVQTFNLFTDQYIIYDFYYILDSEIKPLTSFTSYGDKALFDELKNNSILLLISLMLCFLLISVGLLTNNVTLYNIIFLGGLIILFSIFTFFNLDIFGASLWTLLLLKTIVLYLVKRSN